MTNNKLTDERLAEISEDGFLEHGDAKKIARELQERRKADKPPVHPTIASEQLDDETLQELIDFRRNTFEYHSKEGHQTQTIIHGITLSAMLELKELRKVVDNSIPLLSPAYGFRKPFIHPREMESYSEQQPDKSACKYCGGTGYFRWQQSENMCPCPCVGCTEIQKNSGNGLS